MYIYIYIYTARTRHPEERVDGEECSGHQLVRQLRELPSTAQEKKRSPVRVNPVKKIPISKSPSELATPVETPAKAQLSSTGFASFERDFSGGELFDRDRSKTSKKNPSEK